GLDRVRSRLLARTTTGWMAFVLLLLWLPVLLLIPERYTFPLGGAFSARPQELILILIGVVLAIDFVGGQRIRLGAPVKVAAVFLGVAGLSLVARAGFLDKSAFQGSIRVFAQTALRVLAAIA